MTFSEWMAQDGWDYLGFMLVTLTVAAPFLIGLFLKHYFNYRRKVGQQLNQMSLEMAKLEGAAVAEQLRGLQERVESLEIVIADSRYALDKQIRSL